MSVVACFIAGRFDKGQLTELKSFTCDTPELMELVEDERGEDEDIEWLASYDSASGPPREEHLVSPDVILASVHRVRADHEEDDGLAHDLDGVTELCEFAKAQGVKVLVTDV